MRKRRSREMSFAETQQNISDVFDPVEDFKGLLWLPIFNFFFCISSLPLFFLFLFHIYSTVGSFNEFTTHILGNISKKGTS